MRSYSEAPGDLIPAEHAKMIILLNRLGFEPVTDRDAILLAEELLQIGWA